MSPTAPSPPRPAWLLAAVLEVALLLLHFAGLAVSHTGPLGVVGTIASIPQMPGLLLAGAVADRYVNRFGPLPDIAGAILWYGLVLVVQWALLTSLIHLWRRR